MNKNNLFRIAVSLSFVGFIVSIPSSPLAEPAEEAAVTTTCKEATETAPLNSLIETGFSPEGSGKALVVKVINSARKTIRLSAYSFTSSTVTHALIDAKCRGVDVAVVVDYTNNITDDHSGRAHIALNLLANAGIATRTISSYPIHHDKFIIADDLHVETGSYNYSESAARRNSENVLVIWNNPQVAASYLQHWQSRYGQGDDYRVIENSVPTLAHQEAAPH